MSGAEAGVSRAGRPGCVDLVLVPKRRELINGDAGRVAVVLRGSASQGAAGMNGAAWR